MAGKLKVRSELEIGRRLAFVLELIARGCTVACCVLPASRAMASSNGLTGFTCCTAACLPYSRFDQRPETLFTVGALTGGRPFLFSQPWTCSTKTFVGTNLGSGGAAG